MLPNQSAHPVTQSALSLSHLNADIMDRTLEIMLYDRKNPQGFQTSVKVMHLNVNFEFHSVFADATYTANFAKDESHMVFSAELSMLVDSFRYFDQDTLKQFCLYHGMDPGKLSKSGIRDLTAKHRCITRCQSHVYVFKCLSNRRVHVFDKLAVSDTSADHNPRFKKFERAQNPLPRSIEELVGDNDEIVANPWREDNTGYTAMTGSAHLNVIGSDQKLEIIREWQRVMCTDNLRPLTCAVCSVRTPKLDSERVHANKIDLNILRNNQLPAFLLPKTYNLMAYSFALLNPKGLECKDSLGYMRLCNRCFKSLSASSVPKFALCNWLYYGREALPEDVKKAFKESSIFERMLICRARSNSITCRFNARGKKSDDLADNVGEDGKDRSSRDNALGRARRGIRGNIIVAPLDALKMNNVIPPPATAIRDTMSTIFIGRNVPTRENIKQYSPVLVRRSRVKAMIQFLLQVNPYYHESDNFKYSQKNMDSISSGDDSDDQLPSAVYVGYLAPNEAVETATSDYTTRNVIRVADGQEDGELLMENVGYTDGDSSPLSYQQMKNVALERCLSGKPFLGSGTGSDIVPDFSNPAILTWLFPHLDPWGIGGFYHPQRRQKISMEEQLRHMLMIDDNAFESDPEFAFVFYNVCRKSLVTHSLRFSVSASMHANIVKDLLRLDPEVLAQLNVACEKDPYYRPVNDSEKEAFRCLSSVHMVSKHVPGSDGYKTMLRNEIRGLMNHRGAPTLFVTLNPSDVDNPIVRLLAGGEIDMEDVTRGEDLNKWKRSLFAAKNPSACARFFDLVIKNFIDIILGYGREGGGIYGRCTSYYGTVEAQGKGTLHCHMLIWLEGHLSPQRLRDRLVLSDKYKNEFLTWLESVIKCEFPNSTGVYSQRRLHPQRILHHDNGDPHPGVIAPPLVNDYRTPEEFWEDYTRFVETLLHHYAWHEHTETCWKYLERGQEKTDSNCRVGMDGKTVEHSKLDDETFEIILRRHHPSIAAHTDLVTFLMRCNMDIKYIGTGDAANAFVYYVTDYITKSSLSVHVGMAALLHVINRLKGTGSNNTLQSDINGSAVRAVTAAVNSMMGRQEISHPQVMSYLVGGGDHYKSDKFAVLQWGSIRQSCPVASSSTSTEGEPVEVNASESISLLLEHKNLTVSSQQFDYTFRSTDAVFDSLCLYDFVAVTSKVRYTKARENNEYRPGSFDSSHPQYLTHRLIRSRDCRIPVLLGPRIPNPGRSAEYKEEWARDMLLLFKPWRDVNDLKAHGLTWNEGYSQFEPTMSREHKKITAHMLVSTECAEARDRHREQRRGKRIDDVMVDSTADALVSDYGVDAGERCVENQYVYNPFEYFDSGDPLSDAYHIETRDIVDQETYQLLDTCFPEIIHHVDEPSLAFADKVCDNDSITLREQSDLMKKKRKRKLAACDEGDTDTRKRVRPDVEPLSRWLTLDEDGIRSNKLTAYAVADNVTLSMGLNTNKEQLRAFRIIAEHIIEGKTDQLMMYVAGVGGTGKSHLIKAIVLLFERLGIRDQLLLGAPTGIAAVLIKGQTLHSLILARPNGRSNDISALSKIWRLGRLFILDEVSMLGSKFVSEFSSCVRLARGDHIIDREKPFGGINIVFMGDFGQLKPPKQPALYSRNLVKHPSFAEARNNSGISAVNGAFIWRQVNTVVELVKNQRQAADPDYAAFLSRLRLRQCISMPQDGMPYSDLEYLYSRLIVNMASNTAVMMEFWDAPIIVGSKALRDLLNVKLVKYHARKLQSELSTYFSLDIVDKAPAGGPNQRKLWNLPSSENSEAFGRLPLFIGMKVMVTENLAFDNGIVNGSEGTVTGIKYQEDSSGRRYAKVVYVRIPGCGMSVDGLDIDVVPIFPVSTRLQHNLPNTKARSFTRKQIPLVPAYVYTDFKAQGRTTDRAIVDLATARGQGVYIMLSRVRSISGLLILRWFPPSKIYQRLPEELRDELDRLHELKNETEARHTFSWLTDGL